LVNFLLSGFEKFSHQENPQTAGLPSARYILWVHRLALAGYKSTPADSSKRCGYLKLQIATPAARVCDDFFLVRTERSLPLGAGGTLVPFWGFEPTTY